jgi:hypothetical protein
MRVMDLPGWPPKPAKPYEGKLVPLDDARVETVTGDAEGHISFVCRRRGELIPFEFFIWDRKNSSSFQKVLREHPGTTLFDIGFIALTQD